MIIDIVTAQKIRSHPVTYMLNTGPERVIKDQFLTEAREAAVREVSRAFAIPAGTLSPDDVHLSWAYAGGDLFRFEIAWWPQTGEHITRVDPDSVEPKGADGMTLDHLIGWDTDQRVWVFERQAFGVDITLLGGRRSGNVSS